MMSDNDGMRLPIVGQTALHVAFACRASFQAVVGALFQQTSSPLHAICTLLMPAERTSQ